LYQLESKRQITEELEKKFHKPKKSIADRYHKTREEHHGHPVYYLLALQKEKHDEL
jgi:hypothetical protein